MKKNKSNSNQYITELIKRDVLKKYRESGNENRLFFDPTIMEMKLIKQYNISENQAIEFFKEIDSNDEFIKVDSTFYKLNENKLKTKIQKKYNLAINHIESFKFKSSQHKKENLTYNTLYKEIYEEENTEIILATTLSVIAGIIITVGFTNMSNKNIKEYQNYKNSIVTCDNNEYNLSDLYIVYTKENSYICTRKLEKINVETTIIQSGHGSNEYYYRDDIYSYYNIENGNKICKDHEEGFYIENLFSFYSLSDMKEKDFELNINEIKEEITSDYLISRTPNVKRKR